jgi:hypothetical protein
MKLGKVGNWCDTVQRTAMEQELWMAIYFASSERLFGAPQAACRHNSHVTSAMADGMAFAL